jgi:beta-fructofuranosidase
MVVGSGIKDIGGAALLYRSPDLIHWEYMRPLCVGDKNETGEMWECPSFFPLGNKHALFFSNYLFNPVEYFTGSYQNYRFEPERQGRLDHSGLFYAPQSFADRLGRRLIFGWVRESRSDALAAAAGWSGMQSVPRALVLRADGRLGIEPAPELQILRGQHFRQTDLTVSPDLTPLSRETQGNSLEIVVEFKPEGAHQYGLSLLRSPNGEEETTVTYDRVAQTLTIDRARSCAKPDGIDVTPQSAPLTLLEGETLSLHVFVDCSIIEVFANGHTALTSRIYPTRHDSLGLDAFARDGEMTIRQIDIWHLDSIW